MEERLPKQKNAWLILLIVVLFVVALIFFAIGGGNQTEPDAEMTTQPANEVLTSKRVELSFYNTPLLDGRVANYELWIESPEGLKSYGKFNLDDSNKVVLDVLISSQAIKESADVLITVERAEDSNPDQPSTPIVFLGTLEQDHAQLAFVIDYQLVSGSYLLTTPSDGEQNNPKSGVWFMSADREQASLDLAPLADGWQYAAWLKYKDYYLPIGYFNQANQADNQSNYSAEKATPAFVGEDYLRNLPATLSAPLDLTKNKAQVIVSLQPIADAEDIAWFSVSDQRQYKPYLVILQATVSQEAEPETVYDLALTQTTPSVDLVIKSLETASDD